MHASGCRAEIVGRESRALPAAGDGLDAAGYERRRVSAAFARTSSGAVRDHRQRVSLRAARGGCGVPAKTISAGDAGAGRGADSESVAGLIATAPIGSGAHAGTAGRGAVFGD